jgi:hypothetical protein
VFRLGGKRVSKYDYSCVSLMRYILTGTGIARAMERKRAGKESLGCIAKFFER